MAIIPSKVLCSSGHGHRDEDRGMFHKQEGVVGFETKYCETPRAFPLMGRGRTHRSVAAVCLKESERDFVLNLRNIYTLAFDHV